MGTASPVKHLSVFLFLFVNVFFFSSEVNSVEHLHAVDTSALDDIQNVVKPNL